MSNANRDEQANAQAPSAGSALAIIDKVWEFTWATRIICIGLCFDTTLVCYPGGGLLAWATGEPPALTLGWYAAALTIFCILAAYAMPIVLFFWKLLARQIYVRLPRSGESGRSRRTVFAYQLRDRALREQNQFLLDLYERHQSARRAQLAEADDLASLLAMMVVFILVNWGVGWLFAKAPTLVYAFAAWAGDPGKLLLAIMLIFFAIQATSIWLTDQPNIIYYPPLAEELDAQYRKELAELRKFERDHS
ncbi:MULTISPECIES: hypothetical protein [Pseudomonas]|uniref:hypothetical protein n=1 Tax=Pseudomonas TaxID=286 RepID=UPI0008A5020E|nr:MULTISPECIES: hypothetical protein [Pseudomonas]OFR55892.1 hypothetical protein HMPREF2886_02230 [Pseudomonas sp. HMSC066A08]RUE55930.1 hypothetical protein IPC1224_14495 [Pseudomonas aeruginosa]HEQ0196597.1 hypothetical protein [Pseudomonas aeruginosa]